MAQLSDRARASAVPSTGVRSAKPALWRRWLAIALRTGHLAGVVLLGAALYGAAVRPGAGGALTVATGIGLLAMEWADRRIRLTELAGAFSLLKFLAVAWMASAPAVAPATFWLVLVGSGAISHAARNVRHWRAGR